MAGNVKLMTSAGGGVVLDTATTTATDVTVKVPVTGVNNGTLVCSNASGNVGIGTSSPGQKFVIKCPSDGAAVNATSGFSVVRSANDTRLTIGYATTPDAFVISSTYDSTGSFKPLAFATSDTERMRIDSSGNLLVGTKSFAGIATGSSLNSGSWIAGGLFAAQNQNDSNIYLSKASGYSSGNYLVFFVNGTQVGAVLTNGTNTTYSTSSDYRLKENIQPMQNALAVVQKLNPVTYTWKVDGSDGQGFIAHELQAVVPDCVTGEKDAVDAEGKPVYQGIDTSFLVATLTAAIKELKAELDEAKTRIAALEAK